MVLAITWDIYCLNEVWGGNGIGRMAAKHKKGRAAANPASSMLLV
jgi:hypothetical protein